MLLTIVKTIQTLACEQALDSKLGAKRAPQERKDERLWAGERREIWNCVVIFVVVVVLFPPFFWGGGGLLRCFLSSRALFMLGDRS